MTRELSTLEFIREHTEGLNVMRTMRKTESLLYVSLDGAADYTLLFEPSGTIRANLHWIFGSESSSIISRPQVKTEDGLLQRSRSTSWRGKFLRSQNIRYYFSLRSRAGVSSRKPSLNHLLISTALGGCPDVHSGATDGTPDPVRADRDSHVRVRLVHQRRAVPGDLQVLRPGEASRAEADVTGEQVAQGSCARKGRQSTTSCERRLGPSTASPPDQKRRRSG